MNGTAGHMDDDYTWGNRQDEPDLRTADAKEQDDIARLKQRLADVEQLAVETAATLRLLADVLEVRL